MAYSSPPSVFYSGAKVTNAVANTLNTSTMIAAPGVNTAIRIVAIHAMGARSNTGLVNLWAAQAALVYGLFGITTQQLSPPPAPIPEPGIQLPPNTALSIQDIATVASQTYYVVVLYYLDDVG